MRISIEFFYEVLHDIQEYIPKLVTASRSVGELFYEPLNQQSILIFTQYINSLQDFMKSLMMTIEDAKEYNHSLHNKLNNLETELINCIAELEMLLANQVNVRVGEILIYELPLILDKLQEILGDDEIYGRNL